MLEPYEGKLSRTVLRGERGSNAPALPDKLALAIVSQRKDKPSIRKRLFTTALNIDYLKELLKFDAVALWGAGWAKGEFVLLAPVKNQQFEG